MQLTQRGCKCKWLRFAKGQQRGFTVHPESTYAAKNCSINVKIKKLSLSKWKGFVPLFLNDCTISFLMRSMHVHKDNLLPSCCQRHFKNVSKSRSFASRINKAKQGKGYCICAPCWHHKTRILVPAKQAEDLLKTQWTPLQTRPMLQANCTRSPKNLPFQPHTQAKPVEKTLISKVILICDTDQQKALARNATKSL